MPDIDVTAILAEVDNQIDKLRRDGKYPVGLERELEAEFEAIMALTKLSTGSRIDSITSKLEETRDLIGQLRKPPRNNSRFVLGAVLHKLINRLVGRPFSDLSDRIEQLAVKLNCVQEELAEEMKTRDSVEDHIANALSKHVIDRVAVIDSLAFVTAELETRLKTIETRLG